MRRIAFCCLGIALIGTVVGFRNTDAFSWAGGIVLSYTFLALAVMVVLRGSSRRRT